MPYCPHFTDQNMDALSANLLIEVHTGSMWLTSDLNFKTQVHFFHFTCLPTKTQNDLFRQWSNRGVMGWNRYKSVDRSFPSVINSEFMWTRKLFCLVENRWLCSFRQEPEHMRVSVSLSSIWRSDSECLPRAMRVQCVNARKAFKERQTRSELSVHVGYYDSE